VSFATRFAPSPTGYLHRGHAFSALAGYRAAMAAGGRFLLRIEDIDATRCRPEYEAAIYEDLAWLGLSWEQPVRRQSEHFDDYRAALDRLIDRGLAYRCFKTRKEIVETIGQAPHGLPPPFTGAPLPPAEEAARLAAGEPFAWRLSLDAAKTELGLAYAALSFEEQGRGVLVADPVAAGDIVLARKDVGVAYHLAVVVDDALQGITCVIRGEDLFEATPIQRLLQTLLGLPAPTYRHHRLLTGSDGKRFAKRDRAEAVRDLRERGVSAEAVIAGLGLE
jgi:glutamyl-Q tRNA(Asp) synthetase